PMRLPSRATYQMGCDSIPPPPAASRVSHAETCEATWLRCLRQPSPARAPAASPEPSRKRTNAPTPDSHVLGGDRAAPNAASTRATASTAATDFDAALTLAPASGQARRNLTIILRHWIFSR